MHLINIEMFSKIFFKFAGASLKQFSPFSIQRLYIELFDKVKSQMYITLRCCKPKLTKLCSFKLRFAKFVYAVIVSCAQNS